MPRMTRDELDKNAQRRLEGLMARDVELKDRLALPEVQQKLQDPSLATIQLFEAACKGYGDRPALAYCPSPDVADYSGRISYSELWSRVRRLATGLRRTLHTPTTTTPHQHQKIATCGFSSPDYVTADLAVMYLGACVVPLPLNVTLEDMAYIVNDSGARAVVCSYAELRTLERVLPMCPGIEVVVVMDLKDDALSIRSTPAELWESAGCTQTPPHTVQTLTTLNELVESGNAHTHTCDDQSDAEMVIPTVNGQSEAPLMCLIYTSGSTGRPKGACYDDYLISQFWRVGFSFKYGDLQVPGEQLCYMPLNHVMGRVLIYHTLAQGGLASFVRRADMSTFLEDLSVVRPTTLMLVPRVADLIYEAYQVRRAMRLPELGESPSEAQLASLEEELRRYIFQDVLGGRVVVMLTGSAPTSYEVVQFLMDACGVHCMDGYGSTEFGGALVDGMPTPNVLEAKLDDCPELGYSTQDKPYPRGELCVKTRTSIKGYHNNPEATAKLVDAEGWYHSGDIMELRDGRYYWIDRKNNVIKLSQGEFVSVSRLEVLYAEHPDVQQVYLYGSSLYSYILAAIVPAEHIRSLPSTHTHTRVRAAIDSIARERGLMGYEVPRDFIIEMQPFSRENNLLTDSLKPARRNLKETYQPRLEAMYRAIESQRQKRLEDLKKNQSGLTTEQKVRAAIEMTLGVDVKADLAEVSFGQLGGDSLNAVKFTDHLTQLCGVRVPVASVLHPSATLATVLHTLEHTHTDTHTHAHTPEQEAYVRLHGTTEDVDVIKAEDLKLEKLIGLSELTHAPTHTYTPVCVLLTGGNGFLGRSLLLELLQMGDAQARVVCLVRGRDDDDAHSRLYHALGEKGQSALRDAVDKHADRLVVVAGDVSQERLGLSAEMYKQLCEEVDTVLHAGALVNHMLTYRELFGPNVYGTVNVMKFCLKSKRKQLHFVSTVGVALGMNQGGVTEDQLGRDLMTERRVGKDSGYAAGYGASKWASEVLLQHLHEKTGLKVAAYRCSMILPHSDPAYKGHVNKADVFTRLLAGIIYTGLAPASFGTTPSSVPHYDGLPVNVVASSIVSIVHASAARAYTQTHAHTHTDTHAHSDTQEAGKKDRHTPTHTCVDGVYAHASENGNSNGHAHRDTHAHTDTQTDTVSACDLYHVVNPYHADGASMDDIVSWVASKGYGVCREGEGVDGYKKWYDRFVAKLEALPQALRAQSPLPVIHQWARPMPDKAHSTHLCADRFVSAVWELVGTCVPRVDEGFIHTCLDHMVEAGVIQEPPRN